MCRFRRILFVVAGVAIAATLVVACPAFGAQGSSSASSTSQSATPSANATRSAYATGTGGYNMDFALPTLGKSGCMVCHGDRNLIRIVGDQYVSFYIDEAQLRDSAHVKIICTGCHVDFAFKAPHQSATSDAWKATAKLSCKDCHDAAYGDYQKGVHAIQNRPGVPDPNASRKPLCADCHGAHDIKVLKDNPAAQVQLKADGYRICGRCHQDYWNSYTDYYHGAAYRGGAPDAPACWDCHDAHVTLPSSDPNSTTNPNRLADTCAKCHDGANAAYVSYVGLVHRKGQALAQNPMYALMLRAQEGLSQTLSNIVGTVRSWFTKSVV